MVVDDPDVANGIEAINYLYADELYSDRFAFPFPDLMLLDLEMPVMDGFAVLRQVNERVEFRNLPIVVLSALDSPDARAKAFELGAKDCRVKPLSMPDFVALVRDLHARWLADCPRPAFRQRWNRWSLPQFDQPASDFQYSTSSCQSPHPRSDVTHPYLLHLGDYRRVHCRKRELSIVLAQQSPSLYQQRAVFFPQSSGFQRNELALLQ